MHKYSFFPRTIADWNQQSSTAANQQAANGPIADWNQQSSTAANQQAANGPAAVAATEEMEKIGSNKQEQQRSSNLTRHQSIYRHDRATKWQQQPTLRKWKLKSFLRALRYSLMYHHPSQRWWSTACLLYRRNLNRNRTETGHETHLCVFVIVSSKTTPHD